MDYTQRKYIKFCNAIKNSGYVSITVNELLQKKDLRLNQKYVILRHDVDRMPKTAFDLAKIENDFGLRASYYFRLPYSYDEKIISSIAELNHEIGLHYETLDKTNGDLSKAKQLMDKELTLMRNLFLINTVSMHGNPLSKFDNRDFWKAYKFQEFNLIGEVYLSVDFENTLYYSDTGRTWEDNKFNLKDIIPANQKKVKEKPILKTTDDLITFLEVDDRNLYLLIHPERWSKNLFQFSIAFSKDMIFNIIKIAIMVKKKLIKYV
jgi:hypothetical protein